MQQQQRLSSPKEQPKNTLFFEPFFLLQDYDLEDGWRFPHEAYPPDIPQPEPKKEEEVEPMLFQHDETTTSTQSALYFDSGSPAFQSYESVKSDWRVQASSILGPEGVWSSYEQEFIDSRLFPYTKNDLFRDSSQWEPSGEPSAKESEPSWDSLETKTTPEKQRPESRTGATEQTSRDVSYEGFCLGRVDGMEKRPRHGSMLPERTSRPSPLKVHTSSVVPDPSVEDKLVERGSFTLPSFSRESSFQPWILSPTSRNKQHHSLLSASPVRISPTTLPSVTPRDETEMVLSHESSTLEGYCPCCGNVMENFQHDQRLKRLEMEYQSLFCKVSKLQNSLQSLLKKASSSSENLIKPD